ncbi:magnesium and cobalt transport protein CorA [Nocardioides caldifontis]|uniref:magnesium and cobalt transport protein CorA n=1 Tax=Nocardioides caldifontis TaxID=2588938 RepID=UPI0011E00215|nr:magnesium and cobalt transport protein CorA [Nocardioides caldifontis]
MIVDSALYSGGERHDVTLDDGALGRFRASCAEGDFIWVGLHEPDAGQMAEMARIFGLHHLAVEDAMTPRQRPKVEPYDDMLFVVLKTLWYVDERDEVETGQVAMFIGSDFVVTVRQGAGVELSSVRHDLEDRPHLHGHGPSAVVYSVADRIVDGYEEVAAELETDVDEVEASVFSPQRTQDSQRIYVLKREIAEVRRAVHPLRGPMQRFAVTSYPFLHEASGTFFRDIADHVSRVAEVVDSLDSLLSTAFEAHLARIQVQQNEDMRKISAWVAIAGVCTLVAGIYGMNFVHMPELEWELGYPFALALMVGSSVLLYRLFKRSGWL